MFGLYCCSLEKLFVHAFLGCPTKSEAKTLSSYTDSFGTFTLKVQEKLPLKREHHTSGSRQVFMSPLKEFYV